MYFYPNSQYNADRVVILLVDLSEQNKILHKRKIAIDEPISAGYIGTQDETKRKRKRPYENKERKPNNQIIND